jgi:uncharacterized protein
LNARYAIIGRQGFSGWLRQRNRSVNRRYWKLSGILLISPLGLAPQAGHAASYAPLDCSKASTPAETTICRSYSLGQDEARMATLFGVLTSLLAMGQRGDIVDGQRRWLTTRETCGDNAECLSRAYQARINELSGALDSLAKRGPF